MTNIIPGSSKTDYNNNERSTRAKSVHKKILPRDSKNGVETFSLQDPRIQALSEEYRSAVRHLWEREEYSRLKSGKQDIEVARQIIPPSVIRWRKRAEDGEKVDPQKLEVIRTKSYEFKGYAYNISTNHADLYVAFQPPDIDQTLVYPMKASDS